MTSLTDWIAGGLGGGAPRAVRLAGRDGEAGGAQLVLIVAREGHCLPGRELRLDRVDGTPGRARGASASCRPKGNSVYFFVT